MSAQDIKKSLNQAAKFVFYMFCLGVFGGENPVSAESRIPSFKVQGDVSFDGFQPSGTNTVLLSEIAGTFLFSFNDGWQIQFTYRTNYCSVAGALPPGFPAGTLVDCRGIPGGMREIITLTTNSFGNDAKISKIRPSAMATTNVFPEWSHQELFLPWLSLCPNPKLPLLDPDQIRVYFDYELLSRPENIGSFAADYLSPDHYFLSKLVITNPGIAFLVDGGVFKFPAPFTNGFPQFSFQVLATTNYGRMVFPLEAVLRQYLPAQAAKSADDLGIVTVSHLHVRQIDLGQGDLSLEKVPASLVALDHRPPGLDSRLTVNYEVTNDLWLPATNKKIARLAKITQAGLTSPDEAKKIARHRIIAFVVFAILTLVPLIVIARKQTHKT